MTCRIAPRGGFRGQPMNRKLIAPAALMLLLCSCCRNDDLRIGIDDWPSKITDLNDREIVFILARYFPDIFDEITKNAHDRGHRYYHGFVTRIHADGTFDFEYLLSFPPPPGDVIGQDAIVYHNQEYKCKAHIKSTDAMNGVAAVLRESISEHPLEIGDAVLIGIYPLE